MTRAYSLCYRNSRVRTPTARRIGCGSLLCKSDAANWNDWVRREDKGEKSGNPERKRLSKNDARSALRTRLYSEANN